MLPASVSLSVNACFNGATVWSASACTEPSAGYKRLQQWVQEKMWPAHHSEGLCFQPISRYDRKVHVSTVICTLGPTNDHYHLPVEEEVESFIYRQRWA